MRKIAVPVSTPGLDARVESRFGRAAYLLLVEPESMAFETVENPGGGAGGGAGVQAAQLLAGRQVSDLVCVDCGPNASAALASAGIAIHWSDPGLTAREAVEGVTRGGVDHPIEGEPPTWDEGSGTRARRRAQASGRGWDGGGVGGPAGFRRRGGGGGGRGSGGRAGSGGRLGKRGG